MKLEKAIEAGRAGKTVKHDGDHLHVTEEIIYICRDNINFCYIPLDGYEIEEKKIEVWQWLYKCEGHRAWQITENEYPTAEEARSELIRCRISVGGAEMRKAGDGVMVEDKWSNK